MCFVHYLPVVPIIFSTHLQASISAGVCDSGENITAPACLNTFTTQSVIARLATTALVHADSFSKTPEHGQKNFHKLHSDVLRIRSMFSQGGLVY